MEYPRLIETSVKNYLQYSLNQCHENRVSIFINCLNIGVFIIFVLFVAVILYFCYKRKRTPEEEYNKMMSDQEYILSKIQFYKEQQKRIQTSGITNLPSLDPNTPFI
jgi:hypothetical protein